MCVCVCLLGTLNTASNQYSLVSGGRINTSSGLGSFVGAGDSNTATSTYSVVCGGTLNNSTSQSSVICAGQQNNINASTFYGFIGAGQSNTIAASSPQSIHMCGESLISASGTAFAQGCLIAGWANSTNTSVTNRVFCVGDGGM